MRSGISFTLSASDRLQLDALVADRNTPQKHVWRARIVLLSAAGLGTHAIMREAGVSKTAVWRWQERFAREGIDGLLRDQTLVIEIRRLVPARGVRNGWTTEVEIQPDSRHLPWRRQADKSAPLVRLLDPDPQASI
ncbi:helix-turn-helix domain-containing protein [Methylobacterium sp. P31]